MKGKYLVLLLLFFTSIQSFSQKKSLTQEDYDLWKSVSDPQISKDGNLVVTSIQTTTDRGDGYLKIFNNRSGKTTTFQNGYRHEISPDGDYVFFLRKPSYDTIRNQKKKEVKDEKMTKDDFFVYDVKKDELIDSIIRVKSYKTPKKFTGYVVVEKFKKLKPEKKKDTTEAKPENDTLKKEKNPALEAEYAIVYSLKDQSRDSIFKIKDYTIAEEEAGMIFTKTKGKKKGDIGIYSYGFKNGSETMIDTGRFSYSQLAMDKTGDQFAYLSARDSVKTDSLKYELFHFADGKLDQVTDTLGKNLREGWIVSDAQSPYFSENAKRLYFYSRPKRSFDVDTTMLDEEIPDVDVWNYQDKLIQPEQKVKLKQLENKAFLSYLDTETNDVLALHDSEMEYVDLDKDGEQRYVLAYTSSPYDVSRSWKYPWTRDYYILDTETGKTRMALEEFAEYPQLSPNGDYAIYFDTESKAWWALDLKNNSKKNLTGDLEVPFHDIENDVPTLAGSYGAGGFLEDGSILVQDEFDMWMIDPATGEAENITRDGREEDIRYTAFQLDPENREMASFMNGKLLLNAFDNETKSEKVYLLNIKNGKKEPLLTPDGKLLGGFEKAENADVFVYKMEDFQNYPDLYLFKNKKQSSIKLTDANPQQSDFKWGTSEPFTWTAYDGTKLEGIIYKPEDFDPNKKYPLITYFYEKRSDNLNYYYSPQPSRSIVNMSYLVSNDYVVFVPDIVYETGKPGESAYNCIVSGVEAVEKLGYIDSEKMGIQGQSWGGYQVAYLVTKTNKFAAAMAGAPVSNMTSAYGGIRWGSGLSRAFQYERTQSRIGENLWDALDLYLENSPLFGIPNIETPVLIMHNDDDGAVPYYQGIEMFMGMRRLNKPVWMLVYNNEQHNLTKMKNRIDLDIRMMQFFDHYLKDEAAPVWMTEGVPAIMKGKDLQYDLEDK